ncbi:MAG TPA: hypothetical protein VHT52_20900 [Stellaceae bacterium]|nr:hypothetical protein [Stellaceae bacterium]
MAGETLQGMKVAILVTDGFEQVELTEPRKALEGLHELDRSRDHPQLVRVDHAARQSSTPASRWQRFATALG